MVNSHALISCQSSLSKQNAMPCMTIRLTPQILALLKSPSPPEVSICLKDRTLTIGDTKHSLQAFVEDANVIPLSLMVSSLAMPHFFIAFLFICCHSFILLTNLIVISFVKPMLFDRPDWFKSAMSSIS
jgi:hypothetical protein